MHFSHCLPVSLLLLLAGVASGQGLQLEIGAPSEIDEGTVCVVEVNTNADHVMMKVRRTLFDFAETYRLAPIQNDPTQRFNWTGKPGDYLVEVYASSNEFGWDFKTLKVHIKGDSDDDDDSDDDTDDDDVDPLPSDAPFPAPGLTVLIVKEAKEVGMLAEEQKAIFTSNEIREWCLANCVKLDDGNPAIRIWDDDYTVQQITDNSSVIAVGYKTVLEDAKQDLPWIAISNGKTGVSQPLPATVAETLALIKQFKE